MSNSPTGCCGSVLSPLTHTIMALVHHFLGALTQILRFWLWRSCLCTFVGPFCWVSWKSGTVDRRAFWEDQYWREESVVRFTGRKSIHGHLICQVSNIRLDSLKWCWSCKMSWKSDFEVWGIPFVLQSNCLMCRQQHSHGGSRSVTQMGDMHAQQPNLVTITIVYGFFARPKDLSSIAFIAGIIVARFGVEWEKNCITSFKI